jgi:pimeloyl-ACP methyl ester carboxylesterase
LKNRKPGAVNAVNLFRAIDRSIGWLLDQECTIKLFPIRRAGLSMKIRYALLLLLMITVFSTRPHSGSAAQTSPESVKGNWAGTLSIAQTQLRLVLRISEQSDDKLTAQLDSIDQPNGNNLTVDTITFQKNTLHFEMSALMVVFDGTLNQGGDEISGTFTQAGNSFPLIFKKEGVARSRTPVRRGQVQLMPCDNPSLTSDALCGTYEVYEDRAQRSGRKISLNILLLPATGKAGPDPLFYLAGGPGAAATSYAREKFFDRFRRNRDVVLVDQRGTGKSNPLICGLTGTQSDMRGYFGEVFPPDKIRACRLELEKIANLKLYTTQIAMDDLDDVRSALGYERINVYGGSYGSTAALVYLRQHPDRVRAAAVFGVAPPDAKIPLTFSRTVQDAVNNLFADCQADTACHAAYPNVAAEFKTIMALFDKGPVQVTATNVYTRQEQQVTVTRDAFVDSIRQMLYVPNAAAALPALIHLGAKGNLGALVGTAFQVVSQIDSRINRGMQFSVICAEDVPFITEDEVKRTSENSFYGDARVRPTMRACSEWPRGSVSPNFLDPVKAEAPVLMISGRLDPVTPPWVAEKTAKALAHARMVAIPNGTHSSYNCVENLFAEFIDSGKLEGLDTTCVDTIKRPPFTILPQ